MKQLARVQRLSSRFFVALTIILVVSSTTIIKAHSTERFFLRRQTAPGNGEPEKESTTTQSNTPASPKKNQQADRLYPDLPRGPEDGPFPAGPHFHYQNVPSSPFIPNFMGPYQPGQPVYNHVPGSPFNRIAPLRPVQMSGSERQLSMTFTDGLGARLLAMIGIGGGRNQTDRKPENNIETRSAMDVDMPTGSEAMNALQNSTVLNQLNKGVHNVYSSLSRMYNNTIQQQLNLLQEQFRKQNITNPWQERMAQQIPEFYKHLVGKVNEAQENLNRIISHVGQTVMNSTALEAITGNNNRQQPGNNRHFFEQFDGFMHENGFHPGNFFPQPQTQYSMNNNNINDTTMNMANRMRMFWYEQVQPQIGNIRHQMGRAWRDLTSSGMSVYNDYFGHRSSQASPNVTASASDFVDDILKSVDISPDFILFDAPKQPEQAPRAERLEEAASEQAQQQQSPAANKTMQFLSQSQQMIQNGLIGAQRELNQLWGSLSGSIQNAVRRARNMIHSQPGNGMVIVPSGQVFQPAPLPVVDPIENEIDTKLYELTKLQREADTVHATVQARQREQQQQQRGPFGDNFRNFFSHFSERVENLPAKFGESVNRVGVVVNDLWSQIPSRWNNFMENMRPPPQITMNWQQKSSTSTTTAIPPARA